ncbi:MAG: PorT family protein [Cytophagales bacterium]|nr:PorT family protein [Cytophagales bacterium]
MKKYLLIFPAVLFFLSASWAQENTTTDVAKMKKGMPDLPGNFTVDFGWNILSDRPSDIGYSWWGSRVVNLAYQYEFPLSANKKFSFRPGIGLGFENIKFSDGRTLYENESGNTELIELSELKIGGNSLSSSVSKSKLATTFLDIPLEIGYDLKPNSKNSFRVALGGRIGYRISAHTKVVYKNAQNGDEEIYKQQGDYNLNDFRYGAYIRVGFNWINLYYYENFSSVFKSDKGPGRTDMTTMQLGLSFNLF